MYNVYDSPRGFQQKLQLLKVICIHIPEDDGGNEVLEGWTEEVTESWDLTGNVDAIFTEVRDGVRVTVVVAVNITAGVRDGVSVAADVAADVTADVTADVAS